VVEPILGILQPRAIVEVGSDQGDNTSNLLEFCRRTGAKLHVVDPLPKYDVSEWQERYGEHLTFRKELSLNAIPSIDRFDAVLIDGDHNWYTVFNELKLIEKRCTELSQSFPLVILHDIGWPYGRRDLYYDPETIPLAYRHPYRQRGMRSDSAGLLEEGGLNGHLNNAIHERTLRNGVLTAIEDFMQDAEQRLELVKVPGLHGLGILVPLWLKEKKEGLARFLEALNLPPAAVHYVEQIEDTRVEAEIRRQEELAAYDELEAKLREQVSTLQAEAANLRKQDATRRAEKAGVERELEKQVAALQTETANLRKLEAQHRKQVESLQSERRIQATALRAKELQLSVANKKVETLTRWMGELDTGISALLNSRQWKAGHALGELHRRIVLKPRVPMAPETLNSIIGSFREWRENSGEGGRSRVTENTASSPPQNPSSGIQRIPARYGNSSSTTGSRSVDIVICVHNALEDVRVCLDSVARNSSIRSKLYIVNDGSDAATAEYLREFSSGQEACVLLENPIAEGYTRAANKGLRASSADYVVLLNSDTVVPPGWLERLLECGESDPRIGIVGPLSNAASWQSVPEVHDNNGDWAVNPLPEGYSVDDVAEALGAISEKRFPRAPFLNGFCLATKRPLIDAIGYFDEESFPHGYGEENDYCLRAAEAGFELAISDHAYVYHAKSKSYSHERRRALRKPGGDALARKHGADLISRGVDLMRKEPTLEKIRQRLRAELSTNPENGGPSERSPFKVLFLLLCGPGGGGVHSVIQESQGMLELGVFAQVAAPRKHQDKCLEAYPNADSDVFHFFDSEEALIEHAGGFDLVVATIFTSVKLLRLIREAAPEVLPAYYIQDYEPWFSGLTPELKKEAEESYTSIPEALLFAKTNWICRTVEHLHGVEVRKVSPSLDHSVYYPEFQLKEGRAVKIVAMVRPKTPRRSPLETMQVLKSIKEKYGDGVSVTVFGCSPEDPQFLALPHDFEFENRGVLVREEVAEVLRDADIFLDLSVWQAFGRTGIEAMACGCATVLPKDGGTAEYARHRENTLLVDTKDFEEMAGAVQELIEDENLRREISEQGISTASSYSIRKAVLSELGIFREAIRERAKFDGRKDQIETGIFVGSSR
jgi:GT2 family glycosyltransferase